MGSRDPAQHCIGCEDFEVASKIEELRCRPVFDCAVVCFLPGVNDWPDELCGVENVSKRIEVIEQSVRVVDDKINRHDLLFLGADVLVSVSNKVRKDLSEMVAL